MAAEPEEVARPSNYFNYFTEVEERFQKARGTGLFLMSPLDWALVETWKMPVFRLRRCCVASIWRSRNGAAKRIAFKL